MGQLDSVQPVLSTARRVVHRVVHRTGEPVENGSGPSDYRGVTEHAVSPDRPTAERLPARDENRAAARPETVTGTGTGDGAVSGAGTGGGAGSGGGALGTGVECGPVLRALRGPSLPRASRCTRGPHPQGLAGAWWAEWYTLPPERWPLPVPPATYDLDRRRRDRRRAVDRISSGFGTGVTASACRTPRGGSSPSCPTVRWWGSCGPTSAASTCWRPGRATVTGNWCWTGCSSRPVCTGQAPVGGWSASSWGEMERAGIGAVHAVAEGGAVDFLLACDFRLGWTRPWPISPRRPAGRRGPPPTPVR